MPGGGTKQQRTSNINYSTTIIDKQIPKEAVTDLSSTVALDGNVSTSLEAKTRRSQCPSITIINTEEDDKNENNSLFSQE
jgi:hypothetical protein